MSRVLIVEDSRTQAERLRLLLEGEGFVVETAADGTQGLALGLGSVFDVVISDILMPGLTGYELCRHLKANPETKRVPVILLTSLGDPMDIISGLECGADNFVTKPYEASYLLHRVRNLIASKQVQEERRLAVGVDIVFLGKRFTITAEKEQILSLLVSTYEDVIRTNQELRTSQASLQVAERELTERGRELARINEELEAFVYTASHDLKEPLRGIEAFSGFLIQDHAAALDQEGRRHLDVVHDSAIRMRQLIDDLLAFARVGRQAAPPALVALDAVMADVLATLRFAAAEASAEVVVQPGLPEIVGHATLLRELFTNLVGNALKYRRPDTPARILVGWRVPALDAIEITVADNGIGVPAEHRERVFGLFQRLHGRGQYPGTGVGLAICKRIVEEHAGAITLAETPGGGCTVCVRLSRTASPEEAAAASAAARRAIDQSVSAPLLEAGFSATPGC